ncbi:alpha/beta hydrolase [Micromonospora sp. CPCC 206061]|uniref:alpha/beta hydrolase n=1 Tax=Micromonospora sp. CPCC 206061 TaxID=3122410 RepID=UPI002FF42057
MPVHPTVAAKLAPLADLPSWREAMADPALRPRLDEFRDWPPAAGLPTVDTKDDAAPGPHGPVPVRVYRGRPEPHRPALVWMHGGGFVFGDLDMAEADWTAREVAARAGAVVVSVDYRLAVGGVRYPVPHDDVVAAIRWVRDNAEALGIDPARITVAGASAGGNLATGAVLRLRDDDGWLPARLVPVYATLHAAVPTPSPSLAAALTELPPVARFTPEERAKLVADYVGPDREPDGYAMPAQAELAGLCPTLLINAEYDLLRASAEAFAKALARSDVDSEVVTIASMLHGFLSLPASVSPVDETLTLLAETILR